MSANRSEDNIAAAVGFRGLVRVIVVVHCGKIDGEEERNQYREGSGVRGDKIQISARSRFLSDPDSAYLFHTTGTTGCCLLGSSIRLSLLNERECIESPHARCSKRSGNAGLLLCTMMLQKKARKRRKK